MASSSSLTAQDVHLSIAKCSGVNPFTISDERSIFLTETKHGARRKLEKQPEQTLKTFMNSACMERWRAKQSEGRRELNEERWRAKQSEGRRELNEELHDDRKSTSRLKHTTPILQNRYNKKMAMIRDHNISKESMSEFIAGKREIFLMECALVVKRDEIEQLQRVETVKEKKLSRTEKLLEDDAILFDSFLKENDKTSVEAIKVVEQETKEKLEKMEGIKKITTKMFTIKSDISGYKDILKEYMLYKDFLCKLSPVQWQEQQAAKKSLKPTFVTNESGGDKSKQGRTALSEPDRQYQELPSLPEAKHVKSLPQNKILDAVSETDHDSSEYEVEPELYFTQPQQLLDLLTELEEQNLSLIQNSRETEEALEEFRHTMEQTREKMELEADQLKQQIDTMNLSIKKESARAADLELKARLFNFGKDESEDQDGVLTALSHKVEVVYRSCVGNCEASLSALQMLVAIEDRLGELLENMEMIPKERLIIAERAMEREKRIRLRDEKIQQQKHHQEDRLKKALARAQSDIKKTVGKKLMPRSQPPVRKLKTCNFNNSIDKEREEHLYFFT